MNWLMGKSHFQHGAMRIKLPRRFLPVSVGRQQHTFSLALPVDAACQVLKHHFNQDTKYFCLPNHYSLVKAARKWKRGGQERVYFYAYYCLFIFYQLTVLSCPVWRKGERMPWEGEGAAVCVWQSLRSRSLSRQDDRKPSCSLVFRSSP